MLSVVNADGSTESGSLIDEIVREGARRMLTAAVEAEVNQYEPSWLRSATGTGDAWWCATAAIGPAL